MGVSGDGVQQFVDKLVDESNCQYLWIKIF